MLLVKIGGGEAINLAGVVEDLAGLGDPFVVIHGANALRDRLAQSLGVDKQVITSASGFASVFSDEDALDVIMMAYSGLRNKRLVEMFQRRGINAIGLTGLDGALVRGRRNRGIRVEENGRKLIRRDLSGKPVEVNTGLLELLLGNGFHPVITVPIVDENGFAINSENDDIVNVLAPAIGADRVVQLIEAPGFLDDADDEATRVPRLTRGELAMRLERLSGRMKRKVLALSRLVEDERVRVFIGDGRAAHPVRDALDGKGTVIE